MAEAISALAGDEDPAASRWRVGCSDCLEKTDFYSRVSALATVVDVVLRQRVEIIPPVLPGNNEYQEKQNRTSEVTLSSRFLTVLLQK